MGHTGGQEYKTRRRELFGEERWRKITTVPSSFGETQIPYYMGKGYGQYVLYQTQGRRDRNTREKKSRVVRPHLEKGPAPLLVGQVYLEKKQEPHAPQIHAHDVKVRGKAGGPFAGCLVSTDARAAVKRNANADACARD